MSFSVINIFIWVGGAVDARLFYSLRLIKRTLSPNVQKSVSELEAQNLLHRRREFKLQLILLAFYGIKEAPARS